MRSHQWRRTPLRFRTLDQLTQTALATVWWTRSDRAHQVLLLLSGELVRRGSSSETAWLPEALQQSYRILDANAPEYPFVFFSFNRREDASSEQAPVQALPQLPPCPPGPLDRLWVEAAHSNPDPKRYAVVRIAGFQALQERVALQNQRLQEIIRATEAMEQRVSRLRVVFEAEHWKQVGMDSRPAVSARNSVSQCSCSSRMRSDGQGSCGSLRLRESAFNKPETGQYGGAASSYKDGGSAKGTGRGEWHSTAGTHCIRYSDRNQRITGC
ncbi:Nuclear pore complex protein Nup54 [Cyanidiococcus yangmingshanensis]|uniref:Nuclear pore complex protein Nup54 n=1 Tax=Cyanidiococcus yangmingshanensis TaxID=2690220 RepID=A0A7J7IKM0_9RHOD|nr:Nuclear pore complex protein Nup54 [Cyanidiococcus yangmingshanensis]